jgi:hypothetical protein
VALEEAGWAEEEVCKVSVTVRNLEALVVAADRVNSLCPFGKLKLT